jgi:hypothetical protein
MSLRSPAENESGVSLKSLIFRRARHSRMLLAGPPQDFGRIRPSAEIQAESGLDPRLKHSGVTIWESHLFAPALIFEGDHEGHKDPLLPPQAGEERGWGKLRALRVLRGGHVRSKLGC